jgi:hypothetical protein
LLSEVVASSAFRLPIIFWPGVRVFLPRILLLHFSVPGGKAGIGRFLRILHRAQVEKRTREGTTKGLLSKMQEGGSGEWQEGDSKLCRWADPSTEHPKELSEYYGNACKVTKRLR